MIDVPSVPEKLLFTTLSEMGAHRTVYY